MVVDSLEVAHKKRASAYKTIVGASSPAELSPAARQQISACLKTGQRATSLEQAVAAFCESDPGAGTLADEPLRIDTMPKSIGAAVFDLLQAQQRSEMTRSGSKASRVVHGESVGCRPR